MHDLYPEHLKTLKAYIPGKPIEETQREYGVTDIAKLASNENCLGPSPLAMQAIQQNIKKCALYPDAGTFYLREKICEVHKNYAINNEQLILGNGTNELLTLLIRSLVDKDEAVLYAWPSFIVYKLATLGHDRQAIGVPLDKNLQYDLKAMLEVAQNKSKKVKIVFIANPNNPTGRYIPKADLDDFIEKLPKDIIVVLDEAYKEYVDAENFSDGIKWVQKRPRTVVTRTFSKAYGLAALRMGYGICDPEIAAVINRLREAFNVNHLAQVAAIAALDDHAHLKAAKQHNLIERPQLIAALEKLEINCSPSQTNFVLAHFQKFEAKTGLNMADINEALLKNAVIIRPMAGYELPHSARITIGKAHENRRLVEALQSMVAESNK